MSTPTPSPTQQLYNQYFPGNTGQSWTYGSVHAGDTEQGTDIFLPAGAAVKLPTAATLVWTNGYQSVFRLVDGTALSITHIAAAPLKIGTDLAAGAQIGTVAPLSATPPGYFSSATHIELGRYRSTVDAINWNGAATSDPVAWLSSLKPAGSGATQPGLIPGTAGNPSAPVFGAGGTIDPGSWISGNVPTLSIPGWSAFLANWREAALIVALALAELVILALLGQSLMDRNGGSSNNGNGQATQALMRAAVEE